jgi:hypothetical protein
VPGTLNQYKGASGQASVSGLRKSWVKRILDGLTLYIRAGPREDRSAVLLAPVSFSPIRPQYLRLADLRAYCSGDFGGIGEAVDLSGNATTLLRLDESRDLSSSIYIHVHDLARQQKSRLLLRRERERERV